MSKIPERGPVYDVQLIESLPLGGGGMMQEMPDREDLMACGKQFRRVAAGYEILLYHYQLQTDRLKLLKEFALSVELSAAHAKSLRAVSTYVSMSIESLENELRKLRLRE